MILDYIYRAGVGNSLLKDKLLLDTVFVEDAEGKLLHHVVLVNVALLPHDSYRATVGVDNVAKLVLGVLLHSVDPQSGGLGNFTVGHTNNYLVLMHLGINGRILYKLGFVVVNVVRNFRYVLTGDTRVYNKVKLGRLVIDEIVRLLCASVGCVSTVKARNQH